MLFEDAEDDYDGWCLICGVGYHDERECYVNTINDWVEEVTDWARGKGWGMEKMLASEDIEVRRYFILGKLALVHSEVSEAVECVRDDDFKLRYAAQPMGDGVPLGDAFVPPAKPEGMASELADTVIRIMHLCGELDIDLEEAIAIKMAYNQKRSYKHGRGA